MQGKVYRVEPVGNSVCLVSPHFVLAVLDTENDLIGIKLGDSSKLIPVEDMPPTFFDKDDNDEEAEEVNPSGKGASRKKGSPASTKAEEAVIDAEELEFLALVYAKDGMVPEVAFTYRVNYLTSGAFLEVDKSLTISTGCELTTDQNGHPNLALNLASATQVGERFFFFEDGSSFCITTDSGESVMLSVCDGRIKPAR